MGDTYDWMAKRLMEIQASATEVGKLQERNRLLEIIATFKCEYDGAHSYDCSCEFREELKQAILKEDE